MLSFILGSIVAHGQQAPGYSGAVPRGTYMKTCSRVFMRATQLNAHCAAQNGTNDTTLEINGCGGDIWNQNGSLMCYARQGTWGQGRAIPRGSYLGSCDIDQTVVIGPSLNSVCKNRNQKSARTSIDLRICRPGNNITNIDGLLACVR